MINLTKTKKLFGIRAMKGVEPMLNIFSEVVKQGGGGEQGITAALAKERDPNISLATVYRTLKVLKEAGIVQERILDREGQKHYYEMAAKAHYHFTCLECDRVIEFESPLIEQASQELAQELDLEVVHTRVHLDGYCPDCRETA